MKKKTTTDGRRNRYEPLTPQQLRAGAADLEALSGKLQAAAIEIEELNLDGVQIDGRNMIADAIAGLRIATKRIKGALYQVRLDRE